MKIYLASSWRNEYQPGIVHILRELGHEVYDFKNPPSGIKGFAWSDIDPGWLHWSANRFREALTHPLAEKGFESDFLGMRWAEVGIMLLPCGRSANTEAGWMKGAGKTVYVLQLDPQEPELMYKLYDGLITSIDELIRTVGRIAKTA